MQDWLRPSSKKCPLPKVGPEAGTWVLMISHRNQVKETGAKGGFHYKGKPHEAMGRKRGSPVTWPQGLCLCSPPRPYLCLPHRPATSILCPSGSSGHPSLVICGPRQVPIPQGAMDEVWWTRQPRRGRKPKLELGPPGCHGRCPGKGVMVGGGRSKKLRRSQEKDGGGVADSKVEWAGVIMFYFGAVWLEQTGLCGRSEAVLPCVAETAVMGRELMQWVGDNRRGAHRGALPSPGSHSCLHPPALFLHAMS